MDQKGRLVVVLVIAAICLIAIPGVWLLGSRRNSSMYARLDEFNQSKAELAGHDLQIYWIGEYPAELSGLEQVTSVIAPGDLTEDNMPIKVPEFHFTTYNQDGNKTSENVPRKYAGDLLIVIYNVSFLEQEDLDILKNCISENEVPVLAIGSDSVSLVRNMLMYSRDLNGSTSFYYRLGEGYVNNPLDADKVSAGGIDLGEGYVSYINDLFGYNMPADEEDAGVEMSA